MQRNYSKQHLNFQKNYFVFRKVFRYTPDEEIWTGEWERHPVGPLTQKQAYDVQLWLEKSYGHGSSYRTTIQRLTRFIQEN